MRTYADGQLAATATAIFTAGQDANYPSDGDVLVTLQLANTSGATTETVTITFKRQGGTARRLARVILSPNETATIAGISMQQGDVLLGATTNATTVDYILGGSAAVTFSVQTFNSSGASKQVAGATITSATTITSDSANALAVGRQGTTTPALNVDASAATSVTGLNIAAAAAAGGLALSVTSSGAAESLALDAKGTGTIILQGTSTGSVLFGAAATPAASDGVALGSASKQWSDLFLAEGGVINWDNGDVTITQTNNVLAVAGTTSTTFDGQVNPATDDAASLGTTALGWSDLHLATGGVINWANGEVTITEEDANTLTVGGCTAVKLGAVTLNVTGTRLVQSFHTDITSTNAVTVDSSETVKRDIQAYQGDALAAVSGMDVITFRHLESLDPTGDIKVGLRAESVREPLLLKNIARPDGGEYPGVNLYALAGITVRAIQQLAAQMNKIEGRLPAAA